MIGGGTKYIARTWPDGGEFTRRKNGRWARPSRENSGPGKIEAGQSEAGQSGGCKQKQK